MTRYSVVDILQELVLPSYKIQFFYDFGLWILFPVLDRKRKRERERERKKEKERESVCV